MDKIDSFSDFFKGTMGEHGVWQASLYIAHGWIDMTEAVQDLCRGTCSCCMARKVAVYELNPTAASRLPLISVCRY